MEEEDFIPFDSSSEGDQEPIIELKPVALGDIRSVDILTPIPTPPWVPYKPKYSSNLTELLTEEITDFIEYIKPTKEEHYIRLLTLKRLEQVVECVFPGAKMQVFGSFETKMYLPSSDLDVCVIGENIYPPMCLNVMKTALIKAGSTSRIEVIGKAKVPIIKIVDALTNFQVDISFTESNGAKAVKMVRDLIDQCGSALQGLMLVLKQFLVQRHLNEVFTGGISSYSLLLMIASFLKIHPKIQSGEIDPMKNLGVLLIEFFELYGKYFNYERNGIAVYNDECYYFDKKAQGFYQENSYDRLSIIDPNEDSNDISRGSYNFRNVKNEFSRAYRRLVAMIGAGYERRITARDIIDPKRTQRSDLMISLLGSILTLDRSVLEQRLFVEKCYESIHNDQPRLLENIERPYLPPAPELAKRKRDADVEYIEANESDEDGAVDSEESLELELHHHAKRKRASAREPNSISFAFRNEQIRTGGKVNNSSYRDSDGLSYNFNAKSGKKFEGFKGSNKRGTYKK